MDSPNNQEEKNKEHSSSKDMKIHQTNLSQVDIKSTSGTGPTVLLFWVWNWFATLPKTVTNIYADIKSGELLARFTLLDAMLQFIVAVATSCHPQEESVESEECNKSSNDSLKSNKNKGEGIQVFGGQGRILRSRIVETNS